MRCVPACVYLHVPVCMHMCVCIHAFTVCMFLHMFMYAYLGYGVHVSAYMVCVLCISN